MTLLRFTNCRLLITILMLPFWVLGCSSIKIKSRFDPNYSKVLSRVFVVSELSRVSDRFARWSHENVVSWFSAVAISVDVLTVDRLSLSSDERSYMEEAVAFAPDAVLLLVPSERAWAISGRISSATIVASLYDWETKERFWVAEITLESGDVSVPLGKDAAEKLAKNIIKQLRKDGLLIQGKAHAELREYMQVVLSNTALLQPALWSGNERLNQRNWRRG